MGTAHGRGMNVHGHSLLHRTPAHVKILGLVAFMLTVVATPAHLHGVFGGYLLILMLAAAAARIPPRWFFPRMLVEMPFLVFAALIPFIAPGPRVDVWCLSMSQTGLEDAFGLFAKGTLGVIAGLTLAATTEPAELVRGLEQLRLPRQLVEILSFMVRYLGIVGGDLARMRVALASRGFVASNPRHWPLLAATIGALFIRSFERGERVHRAMVARGYESRTPL